MAGLSNVSIKIIAKDRTKRAFRSVKKGVKSVATSLFSLKTGMISAAGIAGIGYLIKRSLDASDELMKMSRTVGVSAEALQRLRHAASLAGVQSKQLDKAIQKFAVNIADAAKGTGEAKDVFEKYGIATKKADGSLRSVGSVLGDTADMLKGVSNATERADIAYSLFGARGAGLINMLQGGKVALHDTMLEADKLGLVIGEKTLLGVERANDAMMRFGAYLSGTFNKIVANLAPIIETITDSLRGWIEGKIDSSGGMGKAVKEMTVAVVDGLITFLESLEQMSLALNKFIYDMQAAIYAWREFIPGMDDMAKPVRRAAISLDGLQTKLFILKLQLESTSTASEKTFTDLGEDSETGTNKAKKNLVELSDTAKSAMASVKSSIESNLTDALMKAKTFGDAFKSIMNEVARQIIKNQIAAPIAEGISGSLSGLFKANGGPVRGGSSYIVGERGPELFTPGSSGNITANNQLGGGGVVNVTYSPQVNALDPRTAATVIAQNAPTVVGIIRQAMNRNGRAIAI